MQRSLDPNPLLLTLLQEGVDSSRRAWTIAQPGPNPLLLVLLLDELQRHPLRLLVAPLLLRVLAAAAAPAAARILAVVAVSIPVPLLEQLPHHSLCGVAGCLVGYHPWAAGEGGRADARSVWEPNRAAWDAVTPQSGLLCALASGCVGRNKPHTKVGSSHPDRTPGRNTEMTSGGRPASRVASTRVTMGVHAGLCAGAGL